MILYVQQYNIEIKRTLLFDNGSDFQTLQVPFQKMFF